MAWFNNKEDDKDNKDNKDKNNAIKNQEDIELKPAEVKAKLDKIDSLETKVAILDDVKKTSDRMASFLDEQDAAKRKRQADDLAKKTTEQNTEQDELWLTDPKKAFESSVSPLVVQTIKTNSRLLRKEIFDENPGDFEFYIGEFKSLVDDYVEKLPLASQNDPASLKNCYYVVLGMKQKEIKEGKLKSKFSSMGDATAKTGKTGDDAKEIVLSDLQKKAAKAMGISEEDYGKEAREMSYV